MSMLNIGKKLDRMQKSKLQEAKADTQRLIDFAGQDLADRFNAIKKQLKAPENDLYYWIKNKTVDELEQVILKTEDTISKTQAKRAITEHGAELICDTEHWKVYHITTFEASQKYGRDSKWCITGVNNYGDKYWKDYTARGVKFYFAIAKQNYDPRGDESKFAFAVFPDQSIELYNQVDEVASLGDIPYGEEINIPGIDLDNILDPDDDAPESYWCDDCGRGLSEDEYYLTPDGEYRCMDCFYAICQFCEVCGEATYTDDMIQSVYGNFYCEHCWSNEYMGSENSWADTFIAIAEAYYEGEIAELAEEGDLDHMLKVWATAKSNEALLRLDLSEDRIAELEQGFIKFAAKDGITITPDMLELSASLKPITENGQWMVFKPASIEDGKQIARNNGWTDEDIDYAELQCWEEEELYTKCKVYLIMSKSGRPSGYSGNDVGVYFLEIRPDGYFNLQEDTGFWCDRYPAIKGAEDLDIEGFKFPTPDKDGMFYTQEGKHRVLRGCTYQIATGLKTYTVKEGTTKIGDEALYDAGNLETLVIPESVKVIDEFGIPEDNNFTDYKVVCKKGSYAETYCKEHNIPTKLTETFNTSNEFIEANSLAKEMDEYENMWESLPHHS